MSEQKYEIDVTCAKDGLRLMLLSTLKHMADFQMMMLNVIGEKYKLDVDEMIEVIQSHPSYTSSILDLNPLVADFASMTVKESSAIEAPVEEIKRKKKVIIVNKKPVAPPSVPSKV